MTSNIASARTTNSSGDAGVEPGRRVDRAERAGGENHDQAEHAVDEGHGRRRTPRPARNRVRAIPPRTRADDGEVDRDHRQDARREVQRQAAQKHDQQNGQRSASLEQALSPARRSRRCG